ncbi:hypothetical protein JYU34_006519 [Plutella xylostella]|uniref:Uncharacterized protein n=1 Tax=Plutella xylostella TaxID=51655 RepID=A0ABQ7QS65_PLUXY|nr:hypothetical protein JYU34_006519 [Plutella xylostella]
MFPNPFDRKHSTLRQALDRLLNREPKLRDRNALSRKSSNTSAFSRTSNGSASSETKRIFEALLLRRS